MSGISPRLLAVAAMLGIAAAHADARSTIPADDFPTFAFRQRPGAMLPLDTVLRGADGRSVRFGSLFGTRPVVLDFEYDRCQTLCGVVLDRTTAALRSLPLRPGRDYELIAIDIDPDATSEDAAAFARDHGARPPGTLVLIGDAAAIRRLADSVGFPYRRDAATGQFAHPAGLLIATPDGRVSRYLLGLGWRPLDLRLGLIEAAGKTIVAPAEQLLLLCYCYDPQTGRYDFAVANLLKVAATLTMLALGGVIWWASERGP